MPTPSAVCEVKKGNPDGEVPTLRQSSHLRRRRFTSKAVAAATRTTTIPNPAMRGRGKPDAPLPGDVTTTVMRVVAWFPDVSVART